VKDSYFLFSYDWPYSYDFIDLFISYYFSNRIFLAIFLCSPYLTVLGVTSPAILRPVRSSSTFYSSTYKNSQTESSQTAFRQPAEAPPAGAGRAKKNTTLFSPSSSGAFSSPLGIQATSSLALKRSGSPGCRVGDSALKYSATQATSNYFADKHQELNLPPKFVKQMLRLEKERMKLLEKEKVKVSKSTGSSVKNSSASKLSNSASKNSNMKTKINNQDFDNGVDNAQESDPRSVSREANPGDLGGKWDGDRERERQEGNNVSIHFKDKVQDPVTDEKKNLKLGKLGKFSKLARSYNASDTGMGGRVRVCRCG
jgi:hypothetical protein